MSDETGHAVPRHTAGGHEGREDPGGTQIVLMGYRGTGKTTAGLALARRLGYPFLDTDAMVREHTGKTVEQLVTEGGWEAFRDAERDAVARAAAAGRAVVALGGGAVLDPRNVAAFEGRSLFVWLRADAVTLAERLANDPASGAQRPSLSGRPVAEEVAEVLGQREPIYRRLADRIVETAGRSAAQVAEAIGIALEKGSLSGAPDSGADKTAEEA